MDALISLPKDFLATLALKLLLALLGIITLGATLVSGTVLFLYLNDYTFWHMVCGGITAWLFFLLIIGIVFYHKCTQYRSKKELVLGLFNKQAMATFALHRLNAFFHKKPHPPEERSEEV